MWGNGERAAVQTNLRPFISENLAVSSCKYLFNDDVIIGIKKLGASQFPAEPLLPHRCCSRSQHVIYSRSVKQQVLCFYFPVFSHAVTWTNGRGISFIEDPLPGEATFKVVVVVRWTWWGKTRM